MAGMVKKGSSFSRVTAGGVYVDGIDAISAKLNIYEAKLKDPNKGRQLVAGAFAAMEEERFATGGMAPQFGITQKWAPLAASTMQKRTSMGANALEEPLNAFGFLAESSTRPKIEPFGQKALRIAINPKDAGSRTMYKKSSSDLKSRNYNYGIYHQEGLGITRREFVTITPEFLKIALAVIQQWLVHQTEYKFKSNKNFESVHREMKSELKQKRKASRGAKREPARRLAVDEENTMTGTPKTSKAINRKMSFGEYFQRHEMPKLRANPEFSTRNAAYHEGMPAIARQEIKDAKKAGKAPAKKFEIYVKAEQRYKNADPSMLRE